MIQSWDQTRVLLFPSKAFCSLGLSLLVCILGAIPAVENQTFQVLHVYGSRCHCPVPLHLLLYLSLTLDV